MNSIIFISTFSSISFLVLFYVMTDKFNENNQFNKVVYAHTSLVPDENGVIMFNYNDILRKVYNPLFVATGGVSYYSKYNNDKLSSNEREQSMQYFLNTADWLLKNAANRSDYSVWEYEFPWKYYGWVLPPYTSALAQANGAYVLALAYDLTKNEVYKEAAAKAIRSMSVDYKLGGVVSKEDYEGNSIFLHILAKEEFPKIYVLNGHTQSLLLLWKYFELTNDDLAKTIFDKGIKYLKDNLWKFDSGRWSYYDLMQNPSPRSYHKAEVTQLHGLYEITKEPILKEYAERFDKYYRLSSPEFQ